MSEQDWHYNAQCAEAQFEAEVERLTRECLDREATETDARERLRRAEERLAKSRRRYCGCGWCCANNPPGVEPGEAHKVCRPNA